FETSAEELRALAHADDAERALTDAPRDESGAVVFDDGAYRPVGARDDNAHALRRGVLDDVRERLLDDAVDRGLVLGRQTSVGEGDVDVEREGAPLADHACEPLERRSQPEVVESRRPELDREPPHVAERRVDELADHRERLLADVALERLQAEQDRRERLPGLVVQLARE